MENAGSKEEELSSQTSTAETEAPPSPWRSSSLLPNIQDMLTQKLQDHNSNLEPKYSDQGICILDGEPVASSSPYRSNSPSSGFYVTPSKRRRQDLSPSAGSHGISCTLCRYIPRQTPLYGCSKGHYICEGCRARGGVLLSCPECYHPDISRHLVDIEDQLFTQVCNYSVKGCQEKISEDSRAEHESDCLYRVVNCPKKLFAKSCNFSNSFIHIRDHARKEHGYEKGFTVLDTGCITSKMMQDCKDKPMDYIYKNSARFPPLELRYDKDLFYCYYERKNSRNLWFFFIRYYGSAESAARFNCEIHIGPGNLQKNDIMEAQRVYRGKVVPYNVERDKIDELGSSLAIEDAAIRSFMRDKVLFRVWWKVNLMNSG